MKPKILVTTSSFPKWEGETSGVFVEELCKRLTDSFDIYILAPYSHGSLSIENRNNINIIRYKYWFGKNLLGDGAIMANLSKNKWFYIQVIPFLICQLFAIYKIVKKHKINIIHAHWLIPQAFVAVIYKKLFNRNIKILATIHGSDINSFDRSWRKRLIVFILKNIDELSVVSHAIKSNVEKLGYSKEIFVYPMGVDTELFSPDKKDNSLKEKLKINGFSLLFVGSVIEQKGIRHLIEAMSFITKNFPDTKLLVVGDGNLKEEMIELSGKLNVSENVIFTGAIPHNDLPPYFATADLFILPSLSEGFGLVIVEALSCKTLAVTSNLPPIHDIISEEKTGFFFKEINKFAISEKINYILTFFDTFNQIKDDGRNYVVSKFDWVNVVNNYVSLYNKL